MRTLVQLLAVLLLSNLILAVHARSPHPPPLKRIHHLSSRSIEILPRLNHLSPRGNYHPPPHFSTLLHSDTLFLTLSIPSDSLHETTLLLRPSEYLLHADAKITFPSGTVQKSFALRAEDYRLYTGEVIDPRWVARVRQTQTVGMGLDPRAIIGTAQIMVHHPGGLPGDIRGNMEDGGQAVFEGMFTVHGEVWQVMTLKNYQRVKTIHDVHAEVIGDLVVFRNSDRDHSVSSGSSCAHDHMMFNSLPSHPIWTGQSNSVNSSTSSSPYHSISDTSLYDHKTSQHSPSDNDDVRRELGRRDDTGGMTASSNYINSINSTVGCPSTTQIVYMGVALDCNYIAAYSSPDAARTQALNDWNMVSALYKSTFNISLGIVELVVQNATCPDTPQSDAEWNIGCGANITLDDRLSQFSQWRGNRGEDGVGLWHLLSACPTDSEVGVAWLGTLCQSTAQNQGGSWVSGTGISTASTTEWSLISHEIGHSFGAIHDCTSGCSLSGKCCPLSQSSCDASGRFIMNPTTSSIEQTFSACTLGNICSGLGENLVSSTCITSPGSRTIISLQQCGNGIVEEGEECDPGSNATSPCCDASTCKFTSGSVCDPSNSACCTSTCGYASAGTVCRAALDEKCDTAEMCTGNNATCPTDVTEPDGKGCGDGGLACASGRCTSLSLQCQQAGEGMNLTTACGQRDDKSCVVSCKDPTTRNQCVVLQTSLIDGSPCGYGGHCYNQTCRSGSWENTLDAMYTQNLQISIPVTIVGGLLILTIIVAFIRCIYRSCNRRPRYTRPRETQRDMSQLPPPPVNRHSDSLNSSDAITQTNLIERDPSPNPPVQAGNGENQRGTVRRSDGGMYVEPYGSENMVGYGAGGGNPGYGYGYSGQGGYPSQGWQGEYPQRGQASHVGQGGYDQGQNQSWVDARLYNGPDYGVNQAYGR
ncbi:hypothetical protein M231_07981 [Tremella mesenterica]|uniref:Disintegrin and metalloproteinase domain-containing protein B n=1 Tax=Tremella mesenterica TaxID=5217 RepID=A0A4V1M2W2_TREME|nr:hypothetical protein M231_07981 [Tremella mesenterica]